MPADPRVEELLEGLLESGGTPEEVCRACPELLAQVRAGWQRVRAVEAEISSLFPESSSSCGSVRDVLATHDLPRIGGYDVQSVLGRGGMGVVYKAWHLRLNRPVAIKMLLAGAYAGPQELERFLREAEAVAALRHPNVVQVYDVGDLDGRPYFTMEFVEGGSLAQRITATPLPARQAAAFVATVAEAIHVAHRSGIVHRDLKPGNILLTADGTPKLTDFGLAQRLQGGGGLTLSGVPMGTPSYMAPEQAQGRKDAIGPATDVYALGAILYELLSGRPPFCSETAAATLQRVLTEEPVPPARLNRRVPRDLETICLKCLSKEPQRRYASAAALADDLHCFEQGEPITARPVGPLERGLRWLRRHPALGATLAASLLLMLVLASGGLWLHRQQTLTVRAVEADLREAGRQTEMWDWDNAKAVLDRAEVRLAGGGPARLRERVDQAGADLGLARRLDAIRLKRSTFVEGRFNHAAEVRFNNAQADGDYENAFRDGGLCEPRDDPERVATRLKASAIRETLVAALADWAVCCTDEDRQDWLLSVARRADPDPWRDRVRHPAAWSDGPALAELARTAPVAQQPAPFLLALGERLQLASGDGTGLLRRVLEEHPDDFWTNFTLAKTLYGAGKQGKGDPAQAVLYYQKARGLRPGVVAVANNLGLVLYARAWLNDNDKDWGPGAITLYRQALRIDPNSAPAINNLALALKARGEWNELLPLFREAVEIDPLRAPAHVNLGEVQAGNGNVNDAIDHYQRALEIDPDFALAHYFFGLALLAKGRLDEVNDSYPEGVKTLDKIRGSALAEAIGYYRQAHDFDPKWLPAHNALRISPEDAARLEEAIDHYRQAIRIEPPLDLAHGALGQALLAKRDFGEAEAATRQSLDLLWPSRQWCRANLEAQLERCRHLRVLEDRVPAVAQGKDQPAVSDCLDLAELCFVKSHYATSARLYAEALVATPALTDDLRAGNRLNAACAAALAGCGRGDDVATLTDAELTALRTQALEFLRIDLAAWAEKLDVGGLADRIQAQKTLSPWRNNPDLAGLRDPAELDKLPPDERQHCRALWRDLDALLKRTQLAKHAP